MKGLLLNRRGGVEGAATIEMVKRRAMEAPKGSRHGFERVLADLEMSRQLAGPWEPRAVGASWEQVVMSAIAGETQISNSSTETVLVADARCTIPANELKQGSTLKWTILGDYSTVITTPGTLTLRLRWGGVSGTALATSGAWAPDPTAASTNVSYKLEFWTVVRSIGTAGSMFSMGTFTPTDFDNASATTLAANLDMMMIPSSAPAVVSSLDTTTAKAYSPTANFSVSTSGTNIQAHIAVLESLHW